MERALVLIGVRKTGGNLAELKAVDAGLDQMADWAKRQGIRRVHRISDADGKAVTIKQIKDRITKLCELAVIDQLIVYFTGHGVTVGNDEYLLLSGAPDDLNEAIYVQGSAAAAAMAPIGNVVLISDACRSEAAGLFQRLRGNVIFKGYLGEDEPKVDRLYAAPLGSAAYEVVAKDGTSHPVYTESLVATLDGAHPQIVESDDEPGFGIVRLRFALQKILADDVVDRLGALEVDLDVSQRPKVYAVSESTISRFPLKAGVVPGGAAARPGGVVSAKGDPVGRLHDAMRRLSGLEASEPAGAIGGPSDLVVIADPRLAAPGPEVADLLKAVSAERGNSLHAGIRPARVAARVVVSGAILASAECADARTAVWDEQVAVEAPSGAAAADVLLRLGDGSAVILPAPASVTTVAKFSSGELRDVAFVADTGASVNLDAERLRGIVAARMRIKDLWLSGEECDALVAAVTKPGGCDLALALYTAYAVDDLKRKDDVRRIDDAVQAEWGLRLFDLAMLRGDLDGRPPSADDHVHPSTPLLQRGWSTVRIRDIDLGLDGIAPHLLPSIWTQFDAEGTELIRRTRGDHDEEDK